uniref:FYVE-type domain-containing protein n=1 Tax=Peronospora matthiolae TaxID=2874970 RepID=A0AAV1TK88_9STRA
MPPHLLRTRLTAAHLPADRCKYRVSPRHRFSSSTVSPPSVTVSSTPPPPPPLLGAVRVDDWTMFRRARRVQRWLHLSRSRDEHSRATLVSKGWRSRRQKRGFELFTRESPMIGVTDSPQAFPSLLDSEVVVVGTMACSIEDLAFPLRSSSENDYNSVMHALYGSDFIYGSLVHKTTFRRLSHAHHATATAATLARPDDERSNHQLVVKACAFAHTSMFDKKNQQLLYAELFSPSASGGFSISTYSLGMMADKVSTPVRPALHELHPFSTWFSVEPVSSGVNVVFRARFHRSESDGSCPPKVLTTRLWKLAEGICKLRKLVSNKTPQRRRLSSSTNDVAASGPRNSRCTVCTRRLYQLLVIRSSHRCELCSYNVCRTCCSQQHVAIYNRHVAPLLVCGRCRESLARKDFDSQLRDAYDLRQAIA